MTREVIYNLHETQKNYNDNNNIEISEIDITFMRQIFKLQKKTYEDRRRPILLNVFVFLSTFIRNEIFYA